MSDSSSKSSHAAEALDALCSIDACCDRFEAAWAAGEQPQLEDYLAATPGESQGRLLRELLAIELEYRRDEDGTRLSAQAIIALHPTLDSVIAEEFNELPTLLADRDPSADQTDRLLLPELANQSGLHIRCPHCKNAVELLDETPLGDITCGACGSNFTLVEKSGSGHTAGIPPNHRISRFDLLQQLGAGAFGCVWKAHDTELDRMVALKIPRGGQLKGVEGELFLREARAAAQIRHPNIVPVHEVGRDGETLFIVSDLIYGATMSEWLNTPRPDFREGAKLVATIAEALHAAHQRGVIHRDLKPSNVMVDGAGEPHLMDFGLAKRQAGEITMTLDGQVLGTPSYMSPEQAAGDAHWIDRRSDIYSVGVMLFEVLTGELPFRGAAHSQIQQRLEDDAPSPRRLNARVPSDLATICLKCLERLPSRRYATAKEVAEELQRYVAREPIRSRPISPSQRAWRWARRHPYPAAALALTAVLAVAGPTAAIVIYNQKQELAERIERERNLIRSADQQSQQGSEEVRQLRQERDRLIGATPALADLTDNLRATLARSYLDTHYAAAIRQVEELPTDTALRPRATIRLADLLLVAGRDEQALANYRAAYQLLTEQTPSREVDSLLAECTAALSELMAVRGKRSLAAEYAEQSLTLSTKALDKKQGAIQPQVALLEATLNNVRRQTGAEAKPSLDAIKAARERLDAAWNASPESVVEVAEALTKHGTANGL